MCGTSHVGMKTYCGPDIELTLLTVPYISEPLSVQPISLCLESFNLLTSLALADKSDGTTPTEVDIIVGSPYYLKLMTEDIRRGEEGPVALHSKFGWVLSGPVSTARQEISTTNLVTTHTLRVDMEPDRVKMLDNCLYSFSNLESLGVSIKEDLLLEMLNNMIHFKNERYEVCLPWRDYYSPLPTNYELASRRLRSLHRRFHQNSSIL